jgi:O-antigen ligase
MPTLANSSISFRLIAEWNDLSTGLGIERSSFIESRVELWTRTSYLIQDFPLTGVGLGQFGLAIRGLYPPFVLPASEHIPHAHNLLLDHAATIGLPGLVATLWLIAVSGYHSWNAGRDPEPRIRWLGRGAGMAIVAFLIFGLADAIAVGARGSVVWWFVLGVAAGTGTAAGCPART